jgi:hypothetical protein
LGISSEAKVPVATCKQSCLVDYSRFTPKQAERFDVGTAVGSAMEARHVPPVADELFNRVVIPEGPIGRGTQDFVNSTRFSQSLRRRIAFGCPIN